LEEAKKIQEEWNTSEAFNLESYRNEQTHIAKAITAKKLQADEKNALIAGKRDIDNRVKILVNERKIIAANVALKRKSFAASKKKVRDLGAKKCKLDKPVRAEIQNILAEFHISSAAYHGGDLNGVCCRRLMANAGSIFTRIEAYLKISANRSISISLLPCCD